MGIVSLRGGRTDVNRDLHKVEILASSAMGLFGQQVLKRFDLLKRLWETYSDE